MKAEYIAELIRSIGCGYSRWITRVDGFGVPMLVTGVQAYAAAFPICFVRRMAAFAACAVNVRPVWNFTFFRSLNVQVLPPCDFVHEVASSGSTLCVFASYRVNV